MKIGSLPVVNIFSAPSFLRHLAGAAHPEERRIFPFSRMRKKEGRKEYPSPRRKSVPVRAQGGL